MEVIDQTQFESLDYASWKLYYMNNSVNRIINETVDTEQYPIRSILRQMNIDANTFVMDYKGGLSVTIWKNMEEMPFNELSRAIYGGDQLNKDAMSTIWSHSNDESTTQVILEYIPFVLIFGCVNEVIAKRIEHAFRKYDFTVDMKNAMNFYVISLSYPLMPKCWRMNNQNQLLSNWNDIELSNSSIRHCIDALSEAVGLISPSVGSVREWTTLPSFSQHQSLFNRYQQSSCMLPGLDEIAVFGGFGESTGSGNPSGRLNDLFILSSSSESVTYCPSSSLSPSPRVGACVVAILDGVFVFGGRSSPSVCYNDCFFYHRDTNSWLPIEVEPDSTIPEKRWNCGVCKTKVNSILLFGGRNDNRVFGDCWSVVIQKRENVLIARFYKLYDSDDSIYNANTSPGERFSSHCLGICSSENSKQDDHDEVVMIGGYSSMEGKYDNSVFLFKCSKRQWFTPTVCDPSAILRCSLINKCSYLSPNRYLLVGIHSITQQPLFLLCSLSVNHCVSVVDITSLFPPLPAESLSESRSPGNSMEQIVFSGCSMHVCHGKVLLLGGGGVFYWIPHYNKGVYCSLHLIMTNVLDMVKQDECSLFKKEHCGRKRTHQGANERKEKVESRFVLVAHDAKKIKEIKVFLEKNGLYDKKRKIKRIRIDYEIPILTNSIQREGSLWENTFIKETESNEQSKCSSLNDWLVKYAGDSAIQLHHAEILGDIVVLTRYSFCGRSSEMLWNQLITIDSVLHTLNNSILSNPSMKEFCELLCKHYKCNRVALQVEIDCGPKRQSKSRIIYSTRENEDGWVLIKQNTVKYTWEYEKVMFASGNNTERKRMGLIQACGETIVDLYAGIGYFSIPIAVKSGCSKLYCFEINEDSVNALRRNVEMNGVSDKVLITLGDNRITTKPYTNLANRILLGLLPSSREGWILALRLLKSEGGIIHVHENVHDNEFDSFKKEMLNELDRLAHSIGKNYAFRIQHIERVKSYAPKVYHYVFDICIGLND